MKILIFSPGFNPEVNEMAQLFFKASVSGRYTVLTITNKIDSFKNSISKDKLVLSDNYRIISFDEIKIKNVYGLLKSIQFVPEYIWCATDNFVFITLFFKLYFNCKSILHVEYFNHPLFSIKRRFYLGIKPLKKIVNKIYTLFLMKIFEVIFVSDKKYFDFFQMKRKVKYLPWPIFTPDNIIANKILNYSCYIGSLSTKKGAETLIKIYRRMLEINSELNIELIGPVFEDKYYDLIKKLILDFPSRVIWLKSVNRNIAITKIKKASFVIIPSEVLNWGLIGDAWANKTLVLSVSEQYGLKNEVNCLIVNENNINETFQKIADKKLYTSLINAGFIQYQEHSIENVLNYLNL